MHAGNVTTGATYAPLLLIGFVFTYSAFCGNTNGDVRCCRTPQQTLGFGEIHIATHTHSLTLTHMHILKYKKKKSIYIYTYLYMMDTGTHTHNNGN